MTNTFKRVSWILAVGILMPPLLYAQLPEGASERYIRVAEVGQLADSINVWGNVGSAGRYLVPEGTSLPDLISFSFGYTQQQSRGSNNDFSKTQIEVKVSRYNKNREYVEVAFFRYRYHDPEPVKMFEFDLQNNDIVTVQVRNKPTLGDYINVVAPVVSVLATSILVIQNLQGN